MKDEPPEIADSKPLFTILNRVAGTGLVIVAVAWQLHLATNSLREFDNRLPGPIANAIVNARQISKNWAVRNQISIDLSLNAGQPTCPALITCGRYASWWIGGKDDAQSYQLALIVAAVAVPLAIIISTAILGGSASACGIAALLSIALWWLRPNEIWWSDGHVEWAISGPVAGLYLSGLQRFHRTGGVGAWVVLALSSLIGWSIMPIAWATLCLPATAIWLGMAYKHSWLWHGALGLAIAIGMASTAASLFGISIKQDALVDVFAMSWPKSPRLQPWPNWTPFVIQVMLASLGWFIGRAQKWIVRIALPLGLTALLMISDDTQMDRIVARIRPIWGPRLNKCVESNISEIIKTGTDHTARLLIESSREDDRLQHIAAQLLYSRNGNLLTSPQNANNEFPWSLVDGQLGQRPIADWTDEELGRLFVRWNIGWIVAQSSATIQRLVRYPGVAQQLLDDGTCLIRLNRQHSYIIKGSAEFVVEGRSIVLTNLEPERGELLLSVRYFPGLNTLPSRFAIEPDIDPYDPISVIRLRLVGPVSRLVIDLHGR